MNTVGVFLCPYSSNVLYFWPLSKRESMGKGDIRTKKGKRVRKSYGKTRQKSRTPQYVAPEKEVKETKKAAESKPITKKATKKLAKAVAEKPASKKEVKKTEEQVVAKEKTETKATKKAEPKAVKKAEPKAAKKAEPKATKKTEAQKEEKGKEKGEG
jgi:30S ribosomal protein S31